MNDAPTAANLNFLSPVSMNALQCPVNPSSSRCSDYPSNANKSRIIRLVSPSIIICSLDMILFRESGHLDLGRDSKFLK